VLAKKATPGGDRLKAELRRDPGCGGALLTIVADCIDGAIVPSFLSGLKLFRCNRLVEDVVVVQIR
jgi:hypothetical protein